MPRLHFLLALFRRLLLLHALQTVADPRRRAAEQGLAQAQHNLGALYDAGRGVPQDYVRTYVWLNLAAARDYEPARAAREICATSMTEEQIAEAQELTREWVVKDAH